MLRIEMLPAERGDALLIEWGSAVDRHRMLVDGGPYFAYDAVRARIRAIPADRRRIDVLVITHIDADHIEGILRLLLDRELGVDLGDVWFNDWTKIEQVPDDALAAVHGEYVGALLDRDGLPWNRAFDGKAVVLTADGVAHKLPNALPGDLEVTLLSPGPSQLRALRAQWTKTLEAVHFTPGSRAQALEQLGQQARYAPPDDELGAVSDTSAANGSSIAMLVEHDGKRALLTGDAFPETLEASLATLGAVVPVDAFKLSHHGSFSSSSRRLLEQVRADRYLISTSGARYKHPDKQTLDLILAAHGGKPRVAFNYHGAAVGPWVEAHAAKQIIAEFPEGLGLDL